MLNTEFRSTPCSVSKIIREGSHLSVACDTRNPTLRLLVAPTLPRLWSSLPVCSGSSGEFQNREESRWRRESRERTDRMISSRREGTVQREWGNWREGGEGGGADLGTDGRVGSVRRPECRKCGVMSIGITWTAHSSKKNKDMGKIWKKARFFFKLLSWSHGAWKLVGLGKLLLKRAPS